MLRNYIFSALFVYSQFSYSAQERFSTFGQVKITFYNSQLFLEAIRPRHVIQGGVVIGDYKIKSKIPLCDVNTIRAFPEKDYVLDYTYNPPSVLSDKGVLRIGNKTYREDEMGGTFYSEFDINCVVYSSHDSIDDLNNEIQGIMKIEILDK